MKTLNSSQESVAYFYSSWAHQTHRKIKEDLKEKDALQLRVLTDGGDLFALDDAARHRPQNYEIKQGSFSSTNHTDQRVFAL